MASALLFYIILRYGLFEYYVVFSAGVFVGYVLGYEPDFSEYPDVILFSFFTIPFLLASWVSNLKEEIEVWKTKRGVLNALGTRSMKDAGKKLEEEMLKRGVKIRVRKVKIHYDGRGTVVDVYTTVRCGDYNSMRDFEKDFEKAVKIVSELLGGNVRVHKDDDRLIFCGIY